MHAAGLTRVWADLVKLTQWLDGCEADLVKLTQWLDGCEADLVKLGAVGLDVLVDTNEDFVHHVRCEPEHAVPDGLTHALHDCLRDACAGEVFSQGVQCAYRERGPVVNRWINGESRTLASWATAAEVRPDWVATRAMAFSTDLDASTADYAHVPRYGENMT